MKNELRPEFTSRQKQVIQLIIDENTTNEIAGLLNISRETVTTHRKNIMIKLGVKSIAGIVREAILTKIVELK